MKKILLTLVAIIVLGTVVAAVTVKYQQYQTKQTIEARIASERQKRMDEEMAAKRQDFVKQYENVLSECKKGKTIYDGLTAAQKATKQAPNCQELR